MSKLGSPDVVGTIFKPTISTATYAELEAMRISNIPVNVTNALIFSIPQTNGVDDPGKGSIWLSDAEGNLYPMTKPIQP